MASGSEDDFPGRFHVAHRDGAHVEVGEPIHVGGHRPWMCAVKLVGKARDRAGEGDGTQSEPTHTLLVRTGRGDSPDDARRAALAQLTLVYGSPVEPPPVPIISQKPSDPPAGSAQPSSISSWVGRVRRAVSRLFGK
jgi:hypothetical protein